MSEEKLKAELMKGDYIIREEEDAYVTNLIANKKKDMMIRIGMGTFYIALLVISLLVV